MSVVTVAEVRAYLGTAAADDAKLQVFIDSAEAAIAKRVGPLASTPVTKVVDGRGHSLILPCTPVIGALTSVTGNTGEVIAPADLTVLPPGVVKYTLGGYCFPAAWYTVVYNAGRATCPTDLQTAVKELVRHLWTPQRGAARTGPAPDIQADPGFLMPYRVLELINPYLQPGFA